MASNVLKSNSHLIFSEMLPDSTTNQNASSKSERVSIFTNNMNGQYEH